MDVVHLQRALYRDMRGAESLQLMHTSQKNHALRKDEGVACKNHVAMVDTYDLFRRLSSGARYKSRPSDELKRVLVSPKLTALNKVQPGLSCDISRGMKTVEREMLSQ